MIYLKILHTIHVYGLEKTFINGILTAENIKNTPNLHTHKYKVYSNIYARKITLFYTQIFDMKFRFLKYVLFPNVTSDFLIILNFVTIESAHSTLLTVTFRYTGKIKHIIELLLVKVY